MSKTVASSYFEDPRLEQAKKLIEETLADHTKNITEVRAGKPELADAYKNMIEEFSDHRGGKLFYNYIGSGIGNGALVELADGSVKYDFITGIGVHYFGHSHPGVVKAQVEGALTNTTMSGNLWCNRTWPA